MTKLREWMRRLWGALTGRRSDPDLERELGLHLEMAEAELRREGLSRAEAARLARVRFGAPAQAMETLRDQRGFPWLASSMLDLKLGLRLLSRNWGLTLVGGLAMMVTIAIAAVVFAFFDTLLWSHMPLDEGDRIVAVQTWDRAAGRRHDTAVDDYERWRDGLESLEDVGAFQTVRRNIVTPDGAVELASIAEITASGFRLARVPPVLGRTLVEEDEREGASPVVVIGEDVWRTRFGSDPAVLGQALRLGAVTHTVVGVMPADYAFPFNFRYWTPLSVVAGTDLRDAGPEGVVFGRLVPGATLASAAAEVSAGGLLPPPAGEEANTRLVPRVVSYAFAFTGDFDRGELGVLMSFSALILTLLLLPPCANIAILVYARTVTRQEEFAARYALGGSRGRIVAQLFVEMLLLSAGAAAAALAVVQVVLTLLAGRMQSIPGGPPFWLDVSVSYRTALFAGGLALVAATIAGLVPALQATGRLARSGTSVLGRRANLRLGRTWTTLVVAQVAFSIAVLPSAVELAWGTLEPGLAGPGFASEEYLTARLTMEGDRVVIDAGETPRGGVADETAAAERAARFRDSERRLVAALQSEPGIAGLTASLQVPGDEPWAFAEIEGLDAPEEPINGRLPGYRTRFNQVDEAFFSAFDTPLVAGRAFEAEDFVPRPTAAIVNRNFADQIADNGNVLGRRFRYPRSMGNARLPAAEPSTWYEVVGVVGNLPANSDHFTVYHPAPPGEIGTIRLSVHVAAASAITPERLRQVAVAVDPALQLDGFTTLDAIYEDNLFGDRLGALTIGALTLSVLLLSAAGLYALMSFTIAERRREIGIRAALGAQPGRLIAAIFRRALGQLSAGAAAGLLVALAVGRYVPIAQLGGLEIPGAMFGAAGLMILIGALAAVGPARRGLRIDPTEALRDG